MSVILLISLKDNELYIFKLSRYVLTLIILWLDAPIYCTFIYVMFYLKEILRILKCIIRCLWFALYPTQDIIYIVCTKNIFSCFLERDKNKQNYIYNIIKTLYQSFSCQIMSYFKKENWYNHKIIEWCVEPP